jgi:sugar (pentulose or hexulose) kinase
MNNVDRQKATVWVVGVDVGTSGAKAALVGIRDGVVTGVRSKSVAYTGTGICRDPNEWVRAAYEAVAAVRGSTEVQALGFSGQMHALVAVDEAFDVVRPALLWLDYSGDSKLRDFVRGHPDLDVVEVTGNVPLPDFTLAKWLVALDADPSLPSRLRWLLGAKDFVRAKMCGLDAVTDWNDAGGTQFFDMVNRVWSRALCEAAGLPRHVLPRVCDSTATVGAARSPAGDVLALRAVVGTGDQAAASRAVGGTTPGTASLGLGTSGVVARSFEDSGPAGRLDPRFHLFPLDPPGALHVIGTVPSIGPTLAWLSRLLGKRKGALSALAAGAQGDTRGVMFFPYLGGRGAPHADAMQAGAFTGLRESTTSAELALAVYSGMALELASVLREMAVCCGSDVLALVCSGGAARDAQLLGTIAAAVDVPCRLSAAVDGSSVGAALLGYDSLGTGVSPSLPAVDVQPAEVSLVFEAWLEARERIVGEE